MLWRNEAYDGSGSSLLEEVIAFEIGELENNDIPETCLERYGLSNDLKMKLSTVITANENGCELPYTPESIAKELVEELRKITGKDLKYCVWLGEKDEIVREYGDVELVPYKESDVIVSDLGNCGALYAYVHRPVPCD